MKYINSNKIIKIAIIESIDFTTHHTISSRETVFNIHITTEVGIEVVKKSHKTEEECLDWLRKTHLIGSMIRIE